MIPLLIFGSMISAFAIGSVIGWVIGCMLARKSWQEHYAYWISSWQDGADRHLWSQDSADRAIARLKEDATQRRWRQS